MTPTNPAFSLSLSETLSSLRLPATAATAAATGKSANAPPSGIFPRSSVDVAPRSAFDSPPLTPPVVSAPGFMAQSSGALGLGLYTSNLIGLNGTFQDSIPPSISPQLRSPIFQGNKTPNTQSVNDVTASREMKRQPIEHMDMDTDMDADASDSTVPAPSSLVQSTSFASHLRASFRRAPTDRTGELVRLLDDISIVTQCISAYVAHDAAFNSTMAGGGDNRGDTLMTSDSAAHARQRRLDPAIATRHMYESLNHDGYACAILESHTEKPLTFPADALQGGYVVGLCALDVVSQGATAQENGGRQCTNDVDRDASVNDEDVECGTWFTVFRRKSSPSVQGKIVDVQQRVGDQVAAGYVLYSSNTRLVYTLRCDGVFSFNLHPLTSQYFMSAAHPLRVGHGQAADEGDEEDSKQVCMWMDWSACNKTTVDRDSDAVLRAAKAVAKAQGARVCHSGCFLADFDAAMRSGGVIVAVGIHLLCVAAPAAVIAEGMGGKATDGKGTRIMDMGVDDERFHRQTSVVAGPRVVVDEIEKVVAAARVQ